MGKFSRHIYSYKIIKYFRTEIQDIWEIAFIHLENFILAAVKCYTNSHYGMNVCILTSKPEFESILKSATLLTLEFSQHNRIHYARNYLNVKYSSEVIRKGLVISCLIAKMPDYKANPMKPYFP
jgi:hypothetical protein